MKKIIFVLSCIFCMSCAWSAEKYNVPRMIYLSGKEQSIITEKLTAWWWWQYAMDSKLRGQDLFNSNSMVEAKKYFQQAVSFFSYFTYNAEFITVTGEQKSDFCDEESIAIVKNMRNQASSQREECRKYLQTIEQSSSQELKNDK